MSRRLQLNGWGIIWDLEIIDDQELFSDSEAITFCSTLPHTQVVCLLIGHHINTSILIGLCVLG